jgi:hypothetical protein
LEDEVSATDIELVSAKKELNEYHTKYEAMLNKSPNKSDTTGGCTLELSALQHVM